MPRAQFDKLDAAQRMAHVKGGGTITE